jgi:short-subunit dehydrogenase
MKKVIVIGASSGIGKEVARLYANSGAKVAITGRRTALLEEFANELSGNLLFETFDVREMQNIAPIQKLIEHLGGLDLFIVSAGIGTVSQTLDWTIDKNTIDTNINGFTQMVNWVYNFFQNQGHGQIANISSIASIRGNSFAPAYSASKAFQSVYFEGLHMKSKRLKTGVIITDVQPGFVQTKMAQADKRFWVATVEKAGRQIVAGIEAKKFRVFVTKRWGIIAWLMKRVPGFIYHKIG